MIPLGTDYFTLPGWGAGVTDDAGVDWRLTGVDGWQTSGGIRTSRVNRPGRSGQLRGPQYKGERFINLSGIAVAPDAATLAAAGDQFGALLNDGTGLFTLTGFDASGIAKTAQVELNAESKFSKQSATVADWQLQMAAPDARRYAVNAASPQSCGLRATSGGLVFPLVFPLDFGPGVTGGQMVVTNGGRIATLPTWTITGPVTNPVIINTATSEQLALTNGTLFVAAGQQLILDTDARTVMLQGTASRRSSLATGSSWFSLKPGDNQIAFLASDFDPAAQLTATWRDAY